MGVRGKRGRFPQARARRDSDGPFPLQGETAAENDEGPGINDLAVTLGLLLQKRDVAAASWPSVWSEF
jgi:hypothetical protein